MAPIASFGAWIRLRRKVIGLTQADLAQLVHCSLITIKKLEAAERRPSIQVARLLADHLQIELNDRAYFLDSARGLKAADQLSAPQNFSLRTFPSLAVTLYNLPAPFVPLLGREQELTEITNLLMDPTIRLLTIIGPGGIGKTHLAVEAVQRRFQIDKHQDLATLSDGIYFVPLTALTAAATLVTAIAEALGFSFSPGSNLAQQLRDYLRPKQLLLLLDNFEQIFAGVPLIIEWLEAAPGLKILVTSRIRLQVRCEQLFSLTGLAYPTRTENEKADIQIYSAVQLFLQQARRAQPHFLPEADEWHAIAQICRQMEGLPLGILLAAAWIGFQPPTEIAAQMARQPDILQSEWQDLPERQRGMRAAFEYSWHLLGAREQQIFCQLAVFQGGFTYAAAHSVTGATRQELTWLIDRALLSQATTGRFGLHELVHQFAEEKLEQFSSVREMAHHQHCGYYAALLHQWTTSLQGDYQPVILTMMERESKNIRATWQWAVVHKQLLHVAQAQQSLGRFYQMRHQFQEGETLFGWAVEELMNHRVESNGPASEEVDLYAKLLFWQGSFCWQLAQLEQANILLRQALVWLENPRADPETVRQNRADILLELGRVAAFHNQEQAREFYQQSLALYEASGNRWAMARVLVLTGNAVWNLGDGPEAERLVRQGLAIQQVFGDQMGAAWSLDLLGGLALNQDQVEDAEYFQRLSLATFQTADYPAGIAHALTYLAVTLVWNGKFTESRSLLERRLTLYSDSGLRSSLALVHDILATSYLHTGDYAQAHQHAQLSLVIAHEVNNRRQIGLSLLTLGQVLLAEHTYPAATKALQESMAIAQEIEQPILMGWPLAFLGYIAFASGDIQQAQRYLAHALRIEPQKPFTFLVALPTIALILASKGKLVRALELYTLASRAPFIANSHWFADVAGRQLAQLILALPPELVETTQASGRALDLWQTAAHLLVEMGDLNQTWPD